MFQRPRERALDLRASMTGGWDCHRASPVPSWALKRVSAGMQSFSTNCSTFVVS